MYVTFFVFSASLFVVFTLFMYFYYNYDYLLLLFGASLIILQTIMILRNINVFEIDIYCRSVIEL